MNLSKKQLAKVGLKKETTTGKPIKPKKFTKKTPASLAAAAIRRELKKHFPKIKFFVQSQTYAGGDNVTINWVDGPMPRSVEEVVAKFELGTFDSKTDTYEYSNRRPELSQVHYIHFSRSFSDFNVEGTKRAIKKKFQLKNFDEKTIQKKFKMLPDELLQQVLASLEFPPREESLREIEKVKADFKKRVAKK